VRLVLALAVWLGLLVGAGAVSWWVWRELEAVSIGLHGWLALAAGSAATLLIGALLVWLMQVSARRGYDDAAGRDD
jgi:hypothetical protein